MYTINTTTQNAKGRPVSTQLLEQENNSKQQIPVSVNKITYGSLRPTILWYKLPYCS